MKLNIDNIMARCEEERKKQDVIIKDEKPRVSFVHFNYIAEKQLLNLKRIEWQEIIHICDSSLKLVVHAGGPETKHVTKIIDLDNIERNEYFTSKTFQEKIASNIQSLRESAIPLYTKALSNHNMEHTKFHMYYPIYGIDELGTFDSIEELKREAKKLCQSIPQFELKDIVKLVFDNWEEDE